MTNIRVLEGSEGEAAVKQLKSVIALAPAEDGAPKVDVIKQNSHQVVPVVHGGTLTSEIVKKIFDAAKTTGHTSMTAIGLYSPDELHCYSVPMTLEGLDELRGTSCGVVNFVLYGGDTEWLIIFDNQLYIGYGQEAFINALVGSEDKAYQAFQTTLEGLQAEAKGDSPGYVIQEIKRVSGYLGTALTKLKTDYAQAQEGDMVNVV
ncbi:MAG: hypothetical protein AAGC93_17655 [Cyanobacteria bacterium P01_F01_bin.53]